MVATVAGAPPIGVQPLRRSASILLAPGDHVVRRWPLFGSISEQWYAKPEAGKLMVSPADEDPVDAHDAWADDMVLAEVEAPLLETVMRYTRDNQTKASIVLGLNRGTLRKKLKQYGML